jgi:hypothetical protein
MKKIIVQARHLVCHITQIFAPARRFRFIDRLHRKAVLCPRGIYKKTGSEKKTKRPCTKSAGV